MLRERSCDYPASGADDDQNDIARSDLAVQVLYEVDPRRNVVDIHEEIFRPNACANLSCRRPAAPVESSRR